MPTNFCPFRIITLVLALAAAISAPPASAQDGLLKGHIIKKTIERQAKRKEDRAGNTAPINAPGDYEFTLTHQDMKRRYRVHVPESYSPQTPAPALFAFHGGGGDMNYMARDDLYGLISKSDREGFIAIFPSGYSKFKSGKFATWNAGNCCGDARDRAIDDVGFIDKMIADLSARLNIDKTRLFAAGMSNGGMMTHRLACERPGTFKAIAAVAGTDNTRECKPGAPVSVLHIHAKNDTHVLYEGGAGKDAFRDPSKVTDFTSVPETISRWVARNGCSATPRRVLSVPGAACDLYENCNGGARVKLCTTETGGHSWPGGNKPRGEAPSTALSANDLLWNFFMTGE